VQIPASVPAEGYLFSKRINNELLIINLAAVTDDFQMPPHRHTVGCYFTTTTIQLMKTMADKYKMLLIPVIINTTLFFLLSILHFYWAIGGRVWYDDVLPTNSNGLNRMNPSTTAGLIIAFGLLFFALITVGNIGLFDKHIKRKYFRFGALHNNYIFFKGNWRL